VTQPPLLPPTPCGAQVEDVKLTEQRIQFGEVAFPANLTPACRSFIQQVGARAKEASRQWSDPLHTPAGWHFAA
jgi:hypothetical protein